MLKLVSPIPPSNNHYLNYRVSGTNKKYVQSYSAKETIDYCKEFIPYVKQEIIKQNWKMPDKNKLIFVDLIYFFDRKGKDPNNYFKVMFDCLTKAEVWVDDDIALPRVERVYIDKDNAYVKLNIYQSDFIGIFENMNEYISFLKQNCLKCSRNYKKCSIYNKILNNYILVKKNENNNYTCLKLKQK